MDNEKLEYYSKGYYLHRLYLIENPLIQNYSTQDELNKAKGVVDDLIKSLRAKEDKALKNLSAAFLGNENASPENGMKILQDFVVGDGKDLLNTIIGAFINLPHDEETNKYILNNPAEKDRIIQETLDALDNKFTINKNDFIKTTSKWRDTLEKSLQEINFQSKSGDLIKDRPVAALEGEFFERIVPEYFNLKFQEQLSKRQKDLDKYIMLDAEFTGQNSVENANLALSKKQPFDVNIKFTYDDIIEELPMQIKTKPMSIAKEFNLYTHMNLVNLLSNSLDDGQRDALQTAIINQHFWSQGWYRNRVETAAAHNGYDIGFAGRGHPTAIERLDTNSAIGPLKGVIPLMRYAIIYNLITGINNMTDQLIYIIVGKDKTSAVLRSSEIIEDVLNDVMQLGISGHAVGKRVSKKDENLMVPDFTDGTIESDFANKRKRSVWYSAIEPKMKTMMNRIAITATLNYVVKD